MFVASKMHCKSSLNLGAAEKVFGTRNFCTYYQKVLDFRSLENFIKMVGQVQLVKEKQDKSSI